MAKKQTDLPEELREAVFEAARAGAAEAYTQNDRRVLAERRPLELEEVALLADGPHTYISLKFPILDAHGNATAVGGVSTDITERMRAQERLARASARRLDRRGEGTTRRTCPCLPRRRR